MKKIINRVFVASAISLFAVAGMAGCSKDPKNTTGVEEGLATSVTIRLVTSPTGADPQTRATSDPNAIQAEADVKTIDVFIYTEAGDYLSHVPLAAGQFAQQSNTTADIYETTTAIATTTGTKNFYVGVNLPTGVAATLENKTMQTAATLAQTLSPVGKITTTNGLPMFSTANVTATMQSDATQNKVAINVKRLVAKITVERDAAMQLEGAPGRLGELTWAVNNLNTRYFLRQGAASAYSDPNWTAASYQTTEFYQAVAADYVAVNQGPVTSVATYNAQYAIENTSQAKTMKELTRVTVKATFIPQNWVPSGGYVSKQTQEPQAQANPNYTNNMPVDFFTVVPSAGATMVYFASKTDADNYATDKGVTSNTYTGGVCYWNIFVNKGHSGEIYRNDFYKCNIKRVVAPGQSSDKLNNPDGLAETDTNVTVDVNVLYWNPVAMEDKDLIP